MFCCKSGILWFTLHRLNYLIELLNYTSLILRIFVHHQSGNNCSVTIKFRIEMEQYGVYSITLFNFFLCFGFVGCI